MMVAVACLLIAFACQDAHRVTTAPSAPAPAVAKPPVTLALRCTLLRGASTVSCAPATPPQAAGVSANVMREATGTYATLVTSNLLEDTVRQIWSFDAVVHNSLQQSIGTLNDTSVIGSKIFVTALHTTQGTGTLSIINPDGLGNFSAPDQAYFTYNQIVPAGANSNAKLWEVSVPSTVTAVSLDILVTTDFPAEQTVTLVPPDTIPTWVRSDTNMGPTDGSHPRFAKRIVMVSFRPTATLADRQLAVALVNGVIVGGRHAADGSLGVYYVKVADNGSGDGILAAARTLTHLPQVEFAIFEAPLDEL
jgi:hypothetical protein